MTAPETVPPVERLTYRRAELAALSGLGLSTITNAIAAGDLVATRVGRAVLIDGASARRWLGVAS